MKRNNIFRIIGLTGVGLSLLLLTGCGQQPNLSQVHTMTKQANGRYYTVPYGSNIRSVPINTLVKTGKDMKVFNNVTGSSMHCRKNDMIVVTRKGSQAFTDAGKVAKKYPHINTIEQIRKNPETNKSFQKIENLALDKEIACVSPWSKSKVAKYKSEQRANAARAKKYAATQKRTTTSRPSSSQSQQVKNTYSQPSIPGPFTHGPFTHGPFTTGSSSSSYSPSSLSYSNKSSGCSSDFDCGTGARCVKKNYSSRGVCMTTVNKYGNKQYGTPSTSSYGVKMGNQGGCTGIMDCPTGFRCDSGTGSCIRRNY